MRLLSRSDEVTETTVPEAEPSDQGEKRRGRPKLATAAGVAGAVGVLLSVALLAVTGYLVRYQVQADQTQQRRAEFAAAASQAVVTLMSIDSAAAEDNVRQIVDNSTGQFKDDFQSASDDLIRAAKDSKAATKATVAASAVQSMTADTAVVLVSAATTINDAAGAGQQPRNWRLSVTMLDDGGQIKMSKVEFVP
ncbi:hypothetical protein [Mycobacterium sp. E802]|uniref:hypothetical protein n=1 Tax=Mycobacterium sp. E802 TaxID=1834152 RepID=UPI000A707343|nr:hypothetical protein [Mycobacterium sp. E802]